MRGDVPAGLGKIDYVCDYVVAIQWGCVVSVSQVHPRCALMTSQELPLLGVLELGSALFSSCRKQCRGRH